jgi:hypothetical protein
MRGNSPIRRDFKVASNTREDMPGKLPGKRYRVRYPVNRDAAQAPPPKIVVNSIVARWRATYCALKADIAALTGLPVDEQAAADLRQTLDDIETTVARGRAVIESSVDGQQ